MIKKIKALRNQIKAIIQENSDNQKKLLLQSQELEWAHVYHDSIRGKQWLENLPLNIGRWAGNYAFFYVLNRILNDFKPKAILELGLGESTKFVSKYLDNYLLDSKHLVIEQDENWKNIFKENFTLSNRSEIVVCTLEKAIVKGFETNAYHNFEHAVKGEFDLYLIDGPFGSSHYSRYDIMKLANNFEAENQFIIVMDDYNRHGEKETIADLLSLLKSKNINVFHNSYTGNKSVMVIATEKYKYATSF
jgi:16S rRNA G966 N2-methylase RsmD